MLKFFYFLFLISFFCDSVICTSLTDCDREADELLALKTTLDKITNQLDKINARNEILYYRLEILGERFEEHERLLKKLNEKESQADDKTDTKTQSADEDLQQNFALPKSGKYPRNCEEATTTKHQNGLYAIQIESYSEYPFLVYCDEETEGGNWTVVQRRIDGSINFYRNWATYKTGFGNLNREFFIGLDKLHALTIDEPQELLIIMSDFDKVEKYAKYDAFAIGDENELYALKTLGTYSGNAGDSLTSHVGYKFSTRDNDNDVDLNNCAIQYKAGWWYYKCHASNLNGLYLEGTYNQQQFAQGIVWHAWHGYHYSLKTVKILIRPKRA